MIIFKILFIVDLFVSVKGSHNTNTVKVIDKFAKSGYTDIARQYCPAIGVCSEGTHVMCMYYDAENQHGPMCHDVQNVTMMPEFAERILDIVNVIRSRTAQGLLHDKNGKKLPRGYGILKVEWEEELATFAQLWANQCIMAKDKCRASKRFPDPGQVGGVYRFIYDDTWDVISTKKINIKFTEAGFTYGRVLYAIYYILRTQFSYMLKIITPEIIANITDEHIINNNAYLQLFFGNIRYVGCGVSAFKEYVYTPDKKSIYNSVFLICNYSQRLHLNDQLYLTEKPTEEGFSDESGCPPGFAENTELLCYETVCEQHCRYIPDTVVLPILDIEDRPYRENPTYRNYEHLPAKDVLDLGIIQNPGVAKNHTDLEKIMTPKDNDFIENKIKNSVEENLTDNSIPIRRNQPIYNVKKRRRQKTRYRSSRIKSRNKNSRDDVLNLLNKLQNIVENIGTGNRRRQVLRNKVASIYRKLTVDARKKINDNKTFRNVNTNPHTSLVPNDYSNFNTALQTRSIGYSNNNQSVQQHPNTILDNRFRNNWILYDSNTAIQTIPNNNRDYYPNMQLHAVPNIAVVDNRPRNNANQYYNKYNSVFKTRPVHNQYNNMQQSNYGYGNIIDTYGDQNTAVQARLINNNNGNYNQNMQRYSNTILDDWNRNYGTVISNNNNVLQTRPIDNRICHQNNEMIRNTHDIREQPIRYFENTASNNNDRKFNNREETYDLSEPRRFGSEHIERSSEIDGLLSYNNREQYQKTS